MYNDGKVERFDADSNSINVTLNPDIPAGKADRLGTKTPNPCETVRHEQALQATSNCSNLCVQATLEEDSKYRDIRVRISNASVFANFDRNKDKTAVVKFCTPLVCKDANQPTQHEKGTSSNIKSDEYSSSTIADELAPKIEASSASKGENFAEIPQADDKTIREENTVQRSSLSSKINKTLKSLNCKSNSNKNQADRDKTTAKEELDSSETKRISSSIDDDTSGYHTSETPNLRGSDDYYVNYRRSSPINDNRRHQCSKTEAANDTLRILERLLQGTPEFEGRRSRSVPRKRSNSEINLVKSNLSGPIRVHSSGAALTAADLTRPEFIQWLTEIKEKTQNVERQLAEMNNTMRRTSLNDTVQKNPTPHSKNQEDSIDLSHKFSSYDTVPEKGRKTTKKKKQNECSQIDIREFHKIVTSTPKTSQNIELKNTDANKIASPPRKPKTSNLGFTEGNQAFNAGKRSDKERKDQQSVSRNRIYIVSPRESFGTQTKETIAPSRHVVDKSTMFKPSKIHKLKNPPQSMYSEDPRSSSRMESPPASFSGKSSIPTRQTRSEKPRSGSKRRSTSLEIDLLQIEPPSTSDDSENHSGVKRVRRSSIFSQNYKNLLPRSAEGRSRSLNSNRKPFVRDSISFHTLHDTIEATGRIEDRSTFIEIERPRETPKPFTLKTMKKSAKSRKSVAEESPLLITETRAANTCNGSFQDGSSENPVLQMLPQKNRTNTPEVPRSRSRSGRDSRSESVSRLRRLENTMGRLFERRTPGTEYFNDRSLANGERESSRYSGSPANRSRKRDSERQLPMMNVGSNNSRMSHTETVGRICTQNNTGGHCSEHSNGMRTKGQQRWKSDTRESRSNAGRGWR